MEKEQLTAIIIKGKVHRLTAIPDEEACLCRKCSLQKLCDELEEHTLCDFIGDCRGNSMFKCDDKEDCLEYAKGADLIREERRRQQEVEGYDAMHDRHHTPQVLCRAAVGYALHEDPSKPVADVAANLWPWSNKFWKPKDHLRNLVRAGALIAAAIDRLLYEDIDKENKRNYF